jgi:hypothetical protein
VSALNSGLRLSALVALVGAALTWLLIDARRPAAAAEPAAHGAAAAPAGEPERAAA